MAVARYTDRPFPPYRHWPGKTPHPERSPQGHRYGESEPPVARLDPDAWRENELYLYGVDLFNHGYWWEAHTAWESLWRATGRRDRPGTFLQGLIQVSAALLKLRAGQEQGARKLAARGLAKLGRVAAEPGGARYMGVEVAALVDRVWDFVDQGERAQLPLLKLG